MLITALPLYSQDEVLRCRVIKVVDGDTIHVYADGKRLSIRFEGVDCPESGQIYGSEARDFVSKLLQDKIVTVRLRGANEGRIVARVIADGRDVSVELIRAGLAWHYKSLSKDKVLAEMESDARVRKAGLWSQPDPIPPWEYRRYEQKPAASAVGRPFLGNVQSLLFHRPGCVYYNCEKCQRYFATREEALKAEYKPCRICKP